MFKKITAKEAKRINEKLGLETWEEDGQKTYWAVDEDETEIYMFDSIAERKEFLEMVNKEAEQ